MPEACAHGPKPLRISPSSRSARPRGCGTRPPVWSRLTILQRSVCGGVEGDRLRSLREHRPELKAHSRRSTATSGTRSYFRSAECNASPSGRDPRSGSLLAGRMEESKGRVVNFRVTHQEYVSYCRACSAAGLNNLSEMVRVAMSQFVGQRTSAQAQMRDIKNPGPRATGSGTTAASSGTEDHRTVLGRASGRAGKSFVSRSAGKGN